MKTILRPDVSKTTHQLALPAPLARDLLVLVQFPDLPQTFLTRIPAGS